MHVKWMVIAKVKEGKRQLYKAHLLYIEQKLLKSFLDCGKLKLYVITKATTKITEQRFS